ncbi:MAG: hypothetical protein DSM107014_03615 [Gomphosphaeria aponina SAG 52.96 = DSM 107014]|uniref:Uncharacterized protein n=1 Tax=Gomphosphaeria aponina SAG 52.96 = DSM 107014 TaxID=1521640 RepID=A0A941GNJ8_9CHRO|nr:hypothetical protein [Gomphosphaeria aponina SAG 52.96 = DSM 107014]
MKNNSQSNNDNINPEKIPGIEKEFTKPSGELPLASAVEAMGKIKLSEGLDCSEVAEDILAATGGEGEILYVNSPPGGFLNLLEENKIEPGFL